MSLPYKFDLSAIKKTKKKKKNYFRLHFNNKVAQNDFDLVTKRASHPLNKILQCGRF